MLIFLNKKLCYEGHFCSHFIHKLFTVKLEVNNSSPDVTMFVQNHENRSDSTHYLRD